MADDKSLVPVGRIERLIYLIRGQKVMLDRDLAELYGVETGALNRAVKRNASRFPKDFIFQLIAEEVETLRCQIGISNRSRGGRRYLPYVFTEHGAIMAAMVLYSPRAVDMSVQVVRAFTRLREMLASNRELSQKLAELERKLGGHDTAIRNLFEAIRQLLATPQSKRREIGFHVKEGKAGYKIRKPVSV
jgi:phage regulator Rha-like protein